MNLFTRQYIQCLHLWNFYFKHDCSVSSRSLFLLFPRWVEWFPTESLNRTKFLHCFITDNWLFFILTLKTEMCEKHKTLMQNNKIFWLTRLTLKDYILKQVYTIILRKGKLPLSPRAVSTLKYMPKLGISICHYLCITELTNNRKDNDPGNLKHYFIIL